MYRRKPRGNFAFIDNQNLNLGIQKQGWKMDWRKFRQFLKDKHNVTKAYMFIGHMPEHEEMYHKMHDHGFLVVLKPTFDLTRAPQPDKPKDEKKPVKGNIDAELVLWAVKEMKNYQKAVVVSGDGDFFCLVEYLAHQKKLHKLLTPNQQFSSLFNQFKEYIDRIDTHKAELAYRHDGRVVSAHKPKK